jgi:hypothetical protein
MRKAYLALMITAALSACVGPPKGARPGAGHAPLAAARPALKQCVAQLKSQGARYTLLPDRHFGEGCSAIDAVMLTGAGVPVTNVSAIQCNMATALTAWVKGAVQLAARDVFDQPLARIETMGAYSCRNIIGGRGSGRSEHASANAVDVSAFILADGRRIAVRGGWHGDAQEQRFLRLIRKAACQHFQTVLSPDYNAAHFDHLHFDLARNAAGSGGYCR